MDAEERPRPPGLGRVGAGVFGVEWMMGEKIATAQGNTVTKMSLEGKKLSSDGK